MLRSIVLFHFSFFRLATEGDVVLLALRFSIVSWLNGSTCLIHDCLCLMFIFVPSSFWQNYGYMICSIGEFLLLLRIPTTSTWDLKFPAKSSFRRRNLS